MNKPTKPNITIPESFAANGVKVDFDNNKILNGFDRIQPDVLAGDNLNKFIDDTYKGLNYGIKGVDYLEERWKSQITNCLLEIPQRIKLELNNGTLTLKAGSQVIIPNGFEADGTTPKFDYMTIESDKTITGYQNLTGFIYVGINVDVLSFTADSQVSSGTTGTLGPGNIWYDTTNNMVFRSMNGSSWDSQQSFPVCNVSCSDGAISSINSIFNGFGYIGSTVWIDKGVKGLIPNGRNEDGTLKNIEVTSSKLSTQSYAINIPNIFFGLDENGHVNSNGMYVYDELNNFAYDGDTVWSATVCGTLNIVEGKITNFQPKQPFRAVDYNNDFEKTPHIIETYKNGTSWYRVYSDGWCEQGGELSSVNRDSTNIVSLLRSYINTEYSVLITATGGTRSNGAFMNGNAVESRSTDSFVMITGDYTFGRMWRACGYIR